ncbi:Protein of unknown function [Polaromonas sp. YR568]|uniref:DUF3606 domain-containing protein n=1 Tax=Polaromonas sp. YR568 TaxID=1855301 RepID=UPI0008EF6EE8|nr:DUF3606 domain-containing protein [Polaromonas sp. YR568]SFU33122.1 Protein of unknown function [Polaromonas sp. YR568]
MNQPHPPPGVQPERINLNDKSTTEAWTQKLNATWEQLREAVAAVGDRAIHVEQHIKGHAGHAASSRLTELGTSQ